MNPTSEFSGTSVLQGGEDVSIDLWRCALDTMNLSCPALDQNDDVVKLVIPGTPWGKGSVRARVVKGKSGAAFASVFKDSETRNRMAFLRSLGVAAMAGRPPIDGPVRMVGYLVIAVPQSWSKKKRAAALAGKVLPTVKPDLSNWRKLIEDALNGVVFIDDKDICDASETKVYGEHAQTTVFFRRIQGERA